MLASNFNVRGAPVLDYTLNAQASTKFHNIFPSQQGIASTSTILKHSRFFTVNNVS